MITQVNIDAGEVKELIRNHPSTADILQMKKILLSRKIRIHSKIDEFNGKINVSICVKIDCSSPCWIRSKKVQLDCKKFILEVLEMRHQHHRYDDIIDYSSIRWTTAEEVISDALYDLLIETSKDEVNKLYARVMSVLNKRNPELTERQATARANYLEGKLQQVKDSLHKIVKNIGEDCISEEDLLTLWREVLVEKTMNE